MNLKEMEVKNYIATSCVVLLLLFVSIINSIASQEYEDITIITEFGDYSASYFQATSKDAVIFIPGAKFDKEGWHFVASKLKQQGIHSISFDEIAGPAIIGAIEFLKSKGVNQITLVGGSRGAGVASTIPTHPLMNPDLNPNIKKMILLAPFGGDGPQSNDIDKLFIIGENDGLRYSNTIRVFNDSTAPKVLKIIPNTAYHAQQLFKTKDKELVENMVIDFITNKNNRQNTIDVPPDSLELDGELAVMHKG